MTELDVILECPTHGTTEWDYKPQADWFVCRQHLQDTEPCWAVIDPHAQEVKVEHMFMVMARCCPDPIPTFCPPLTPDEKILEHTIFGDRWAL